MSKSNKKYDSVVRSVKGKSAAKKKKAIHKMVESLIKGNSEDASNYLHDYLQIKTRELILGESDDSDEDDDSNEKDEDDSDDDKKDSDEDDSDDEKKDK